MTERDLDKHPYSADEQRVAAFFAEHGSGGGDDPIGALLASHAYLAAERNELRAALAARQDGAVLRRCSYCNSWNSKPCGEQCMWQPTDPTVEQLLALEQKVKP